MLDIKTLRQILILLLLLPCSFRAQQYFFKSYNPESGLQFVQVSSLFQDSRGYLWSGGYGGLMRFDGKTFINYSLKNGLIDHNVAAISEDSKGRIFVGTTKGLSIINKGKVANYAKAQGLVNSNISSFCRSDDKMYIGTQKGLYIFSEEAIKPVNRLARYRIICLSKYGSSVYAGTDKGLVICEGERLQVLDMEKGLPSNEVTCVTQMNGRIVIGTNHGLSFYDPDTKKITNYLVQNGLIDENISSLVNQNDQYLWIGSAAGLLRFDGQQFSYYNIGYDNNSNLVRCILQDREDNIWLGTHNGLFKYRDNSFSTFDKVTGPGNAFVFQIFRDKEGVMWICTSNNGVFKYDQYFKRYSINDGLGTYVCKTGLQDDAGRLLFGTKDGLVQFKNDRFITIPLPKELKGPYEMIYKGRDNTVWIGGLNGIASLKWENNKPVFKYYALPVNTPAQVYALCEDDKKQLWIGTSLAGLFKLTNDSIHHVSQDLGLKEEDFFSIRFYKDYLISASLNGLFIYNTQSGKTGYITEQDGLNSDLVYSLEFVENGNALWIGTNQGINKLNVKKYLDEGKTEIISYGKQQGFTGVECNSNGIWEDNDGSLWFGTVSGLVKHEPFNLKKNNVHNKTLIQRIQLFNEDTLLKDGSELPHHVNTISFYYKGICLTNPEKVLYIKKLEGLEKEWSLPSAEDYSKYANLGPGKYTFKVKSCNNEGIWDETETAFTFTILQPFYTTWWFILLVVGSSITIIYIVMLVRISSIKRRQREDFERKVEMSKIELKALRSQMNPHFIFNSLNSIQHYIFHSKSEEAIKYLSKFARLVRIILNNSNKPTVTVGEDLEALKLYLELEQMRFEEKFDYEVIVDDTVDSDYDIMPPMLTQPYVENAILHGLNPKSTRGKLIISFTAKNNFLICTISDNGIGREKAAEIKRTMPPSKHKSMGMKITEDRLRILNEVNNSQLSVTITDLKDANGNAIGTKVELFIPING